MTYCLLIGLLLCIYFSFRILPNGFERLYAAQTEIDPAQPCVSADGFSPEMIVLPSGTFMMGSPADEPKRESDENQHEVSVESFAISRCEITFADYQRYIEDTANVDVNLPSDEGWGESSRPVINVSWIDATNYTKWLEGKTGEPYRLPTEAEWEYAARAMEEGDPVTAFNTGNCISSEQAGFDWTVAYSDCPVGIGAPDSTLPVGQFPPNRWGLFDMHGNVWEWTCSTYDADYQGGEQNCADMGDEGARVLRGGSWSSIPRWLRSAIRVSIVPTTRNYSVGFRVARAIP